MPAWFPSLPLPARVPPRVVAASGLASLLLPLVFVPALLGRDSAASADHDDVRAGRAMCELAFPIDDGPHVDRSELAAESREARTLRAFARSIQAPGARLDDPCGGGDDFDDGCQCSHTVLEPFFQSLDATRALGTRTGVVVLGNSLIASDGITAVVRRRLQERFGSAGAGLLLADRIASYGPRDRTARAASGWHAETFAALGPSLNEDGTPAPPPPPPAGPFGLAGVQHVSDGPAWSRFPLDRSSLPRHVQLLWVDRAAGPALSWRAENGPWSLLPRNGDGGARVSSLAVSPSSSWVELRAFGPGAVVQGLVVEQAGGVALDTLGVPSADASLWLHTDDEIFRAQLRARAPALVVTMLGGNETRRLAWARSSRDSIDRDLRALLRRARDSGAACLVVGPIDAVEGPLADVPFAERPQLKDVIAIERAVARSEGCAFFDLYAAMGGRGALQRFHDASVLHDDLNHPRGQGLDVLGQLIADGLLDAYARTAPPGVVLAAATAGRP